MWYTKQIEHISDYVAVHVAYFFKKCAGDFFSFDQLFKIKFIFEECQDSLGMN